MVGWRKSTVVAALVTAMFVLVQLAIPLSRLDDQSTYRFGWQMYSLARPAPQFIVSTSAQTMDIELSDYMAQVRADVNVDALLPDHLCSVIPGAKSVTWEDGAHEC